MVSLYPEICVSSELKFYYTNGAMFWYRVERCYWAARLVVEKKKNVLSPTSITSELQFQVLHIEEGMVDAGAAQQRVTPCAKTSTLTITPSKKRLVLVSVRLLRLQYNTAPRQDPTAVSTHAYLISSHILTHPLRKRATVEPRCVVPLLCPSVGV